MKIQKILLPDNRGYTWLVLDKDYLPIEPITQYLRYLHNLEKSLNTIRSYANHLKRYWQYLLQSNKLWHCVTLENLADFVAWLRLPAINVYPLTERTSKRTESTINTILAAVSAFYEFHVKLNNVQNPDLFTQRFSPTKRYKSFLHHINKQKPLKTRLIKLKSPKLLPKVISRENVTLLIKYCKQLRDKLLIMLLYETGMRIGQALGLKHEDIISWDNEIHLVYRKHYRLDAQFKSHKNNIIHVSKELMNLYTQYLCEEQDEPIWDYVFVTHTEQGGTQPLSYTAVMSLFKRLSQKLQTTVTPHMLRHTHATELLQHSWPIAYVQKRLGHAQVQTTMNIYSHLTEADLKEAFLQYQTKRGPHGK